MANKILSPKVQSTGLLDTFEMAVMKTVSERALVPVIGNSTLKSGAVKLILGGVVPSLSSNKHIKLAGSAMIIDGVEDAAHALLGSVLGNTESAGAW